MKKCINCDDPVKKCLLCGYCWRSVILSSVVTTVIGYFLDWIRH